jgi:hypothetical protein
MDSDRWGGLLTMSTRGMPVIASSRPIRVSRIGSGWQFSESPAGDSEGTWKTDLSVVTNIKSSPTLLDLSAIKYYSPTAPLFTRNLISSYNILSAT